MGNQASNQRPPTSNPQSPTSSTTAASAVPTSHGPASFAGPVKQHQQHQHQARRRESIQALSAKAHAAPPLETIHPTPSALVPRGRSATVAAGPHSTSTASTSSTLASQLRATHDSLKAATSDDRMGNEQSRHKGRGHARTFTPPDSRLPTASKPAPSPSTRPVDVPAVPREDPMPAAQPSLDPADASQDYLAASTQFSRPPRLPLPIEEEEITPGSPILSPADFAAPVYTNDPEGAPPRRASMLSTTTAEDDDLGDEFKGPQGQPTVPTLVEWEGPGERVYVTGTFAGWNRKYKLHRNGPSQKKDVLSAMVPIVPGTHHLKFIVDGEMTTSDILPTAVDYTNILVNYLEVSADDLPKPDGEIIEQVKVPDPIPVQDRRPPEGIFPPQILPPPPPPETKPVKVPVPEISKADIPSTVPAPRRYHDSIPRYLLDLDAPEESSRMARASAVVSRLPTPPSLPMFLSKSILNGTTPMKDDSSVLIMPNHTVLNHLATSSIKDNILATSGTTRYKQKFLTTIMYTSKNEDAFLDH